MKSKPARAPKKLIIYCQFSKPRIRQKDFADAINVHPSLVSRIFSGERMLTLENAMILHDRLQIPFEVLKAACHEL